MFIYIFKVHIVFFVQCTGVLPFLVLIYLNWAIYMELKKLQVTNVANHWTKGQCHEINPAFLSMGGGGRMGYFRLPVKDRYLVIGQHVLGNFKYFFTRCKTNQNTWGQPISQNRFYGSFFNTNTVQYHVHHVHCTIYNYSYVGW